MSIEDISPEDTCERIDNLHAENRIESALALADEALGRHADDAGLLLRKARLLAALDRGDDAIALYERQRTAVLAEQPPTPHRWQRCGISLREQARLVRRLGRNAESRSLIAEAVARLGVLADPQLWFEAAQWAWDDGEHDTAGRLWHDAMFRTGSCTDDQAQDIFERCRSLGETHTHAWVWIARMRAMLAEADDLTPGQRMHAIEALYERTGGHLAALRIRARARERAGHLAQASDDLDRYLAQASADPKAQVWRLQLDREMGRPCDVEALQWSDHRDLGGGDYYSAGCEYDELIETLQAEGQYKDSRDLARVKAVEARAYELGAAHFEHYFATGEGTATDAEPHIYAMLCNNLGIAGFYRQAQFAGAIPWHDKGWAVSPFWEQYHSRLRCQTRTGQWAGAVESWQVLQHAFGSNWPGEMAACEAAWAYDQLGQPAEVLRLFEARFEGTRVPLAALITDTEAETRRVGLMALAAKAAASLGQRALVEQLTRELLTSDRLSAALCDRLAQAWRLLSDEAEALRCERALQDHDLPTVQPSAAPDAPTLLAWASCLMLNDGYGSALLPAATPEAWQFELYKDGQLDAGNTLPIYLHMQQGDTPGAPAWQLGVLQEPPSLLGRLRGKGQSQRLQFAHSPTGNEPPAEWAEVRPQELPAVWPELQQRVAVAEHAWQRLSAAVPLARVRAVLAQLGALGLSSGQDIDLGICRIGPHVGATGNTWFGLTIDRNLDTDPTLPELAYDPYHFIFQVAQGASAPYAMYGFQHDNDATGIEIRPGNTVQALAACGMFERAMRRLERWTAAHKRQATKERA